MLKKMFATAMLSATLLGGSASFAADNWQKVSFHDSNGTREASIVYELYKPFLKANPSVQVETAVLKLDTKGGNGSIAIRFVSQFTCNNGTDSCLTNIIWFDARSQNQSWKEVWSRHTSVLWEGPVSPTQWGAGIREIAGSDGLVWRWTGGNAYYPDLRSIATPWPHPKMASRELSDVAKSIHPEYFTSATSTNVMDTPVQLNDVVTGHVLTYSGGALCGDYGCPFVLVSGGKNSWSNMGEGVVDSLGGTIPYNKSRIGDSNGWNILVTQVSGSGLSFYRYNSGVYKLFQTTYSSDVTHMP